MVSFYVPGGDGSLRFGTNPGVGITRESLWTRGGLLPYRTSGIQFSISSSSNDDTNGGSGAWRVVLEGIDDNLREVTESIALAGQTPVQTVHSYYRLFRMFVPNAGIDGISGKNEGVIYAGLGAVTAGVPAVTYAAIEPGNNQSLMAFYTVPAGKVAHLRRVFGSAQIGKSGVMYLYIRPQGCAFRVGGYIDINQAYADFVFLTVPRFQAGTDIELRCVSFAAGVAISGGFEIAIFNA
jgi:hypothetical protein